MSRDAFLDALVACAPDARDAFVERAFGIDAPADSTPPGPDLVGFHSSSVAAIAQTIIETPVRADDVFVDLGAGRGKVLALVQRLTGARVYGIEVQRSLVRSAVRGIELINSDIRDASLDEGTVFFAYSPFTGSVMNDVLARLRVLALRKPIVVCALGTSLRCEWLIPRPTESFWWQVYDSASPRTVGVQDDRLVRIATGR